MSVLRARYARALELSVDQQTRECIDYLQNPDILIAEFSDSFLRSEAIENEEEAYPSREELPVPRRASLDRAVQRMIQAPALKALGANRSQYGFSYVARDIVPLWKRGAALGAAAAGLDYVGLTRGVPATPVLGVVNASDAPAPYASLLRLFACLSEVGTDAQLQRADRFLFKGAVSERVPFDLHLMMVGPADPAELLPLAQLTRDLAAALQMGLSEEWALPPLVRNILCLRIPAEDQPFDGLLQEEWRV